MRIAVLGPLEVLTDDSTAVAVPGDEERLLLAVLAAAVPDGVSTDRLIGILGEGDSPESAREALQAHVRSLRSALDPGLAERSSGRYVLRRGRGYALAVGRGDVDARHAADLATRGRARLADGDAAEAARLLTAALALWRGEPYDDWPHAEFAQVERHRLVEVRAGAEAGLREARLLLARQPDDCPRARRVLTAIPARAYGFDAGRAAEALPGDDVEAQTVPVLPEPSRAAVDAVSRAPGSIAAGGPPPRHVGRWVAALAATVAAVMFAAGLPARSDRTADRAATMAEADRLAWQSAAVTPLDVSLLLAAQAFRLADTSRTREALRSVLLEHGRVERAVAFSGTPQDAVLSGGGRALTFGIGTYVVAWPVGPRTRPEVLMAIPGGWVAWTVAAGSPTEQVVIGAGGADGEPWIRRVSAVNGASRVLLGGAAIGGRPIDGAVTPDGRRFLLVVAQPDAEAPADATRWKLIDVDVADGTRRDTAVGGTVRAPLQGLRADFSDDGSSFVMWDDTGTAPATLVDVASARQTSIPVVGGPVAGAGFRAIPSGAAQLWFDGTITLVDRDGATVQGLDLHTARVRDVVVSPDGTWAATAGDAGEVVRWDVDPSTGLWSGPQHLAGHAGGVVGIEMDGDGRRLFSVSLDGTVIVWDMRAAGGLDAERAGRSDLVAPSAWLRDACAVVGRDLTAAEWRRYLPDRPFRPTCTDLL